jgi:arylsulfatase A-like enzyme
LETSLRGRIVERMALNIDLPATMLHYGEVSVPASYQGQSLVGLVEGAKTLNWRKDFFCEHLFDRVDIPKWEGVRGQRWVYARYFQQEPVFEFLHDLSTDPLQRKNLARDPSFTNQLSLQRARCDDLRELYGGEYSLDKIPTVRYLKSQSEVIR